MLSFRGVPGKRKIQAGNVEYIARKLSRRVDIKNGYELNSCEKIISAFCVLNLWFFFSVIRVPRFVESDLWENVTLTENNGVMGDKNGLYYPRFN